MILSIIFDDFRINISTYASVRGTRNGSKMVRVPRTKAKKEMGKNRSLKEVTLNNLMQNGKHYTGCHCK